MFSYLLGELLERGGREGGEEGRREERREGGEGMREGRGEKGKEEGKQMKVKVLCIKLSIHSHSVRQSLPEQFAGFRELSDAPLPHAHTSPANQIPPQ